MYGFYDHRFLGFPKGDNQKDLQVGLDTQGDMKVFPVYRTQYTSPQTFLGGAQKDRLAGNAVIAVDGFGNIRIL